ncbi:MAG: (E)-4-hydroxy-3-methylbut-2-enyl-diphosphate synthase (flavodoxin), partial [uncultured Sphingomonas sp.]
ERHVPSPVARYRAPSVPADHGRQRAGGRRCADHRADHDQHADLRRAGDDRSDPAVRRGGGRHHPRVLPRRGEHRGAEGDRAGGQRADRCRHPLPLPPGARSGGRRRGVPADQSRQHRLERAGRRSGARGAGQRLLDADRRQCGEPGEAPAREIRRALPRRAGGKRDGPCPPARGPWLPRVQDQRQGVRRVPGGRGLHPAGQRTRLSPAPRHHGGGRADRRNGEELGRARHAAVERDRRHDPRVAVRRAGGGSPRRLRDPQEPGHPQPRGPRDQLSELRAPGLRRDPHGGEAGGAAAAHPHADEPVGARLRGEWAGRGARDGHRGDRGRQRPAHGVPVGRHRPPCAGRRHGRPHRAAGGGQGGRDRGGRSSCGARRGGV